MSITNLRDAVNRYLSLLVTHLTSVTGKKGHALYVNNPDGEYRFDVAPIVTEYPIVVTDNDEIQTRSAIEQLPNGVYYDTRTDQQVVWDGTTWTGNSTLRDSVFVMKRLYISPYTWKAFYYSTNGQLEQIRGGI